MKHILDVLINEICKFYDVDVETFKSTLRNGKTARARLSFYYIARKNNIRFELIGSSCNRTHSTVVKGFQKVEEEIDFYQDYKYEMETLMNFCNAKLKSNGQTKRQTTGT